MDRQGQEDRDKTGRQAKQNKQAFSHACGVWHVPTYIMYICVYVFLHFGSFCGQADRHGVF